MDREKIRSRLAEHYFAPTIQPLTEERLEENTAIELTGTETTMLLCYDELCKRPELWPVLVRQFNAQAPEIKHLHAIDQDLPDCAEYCPEIKTRDERIKELERALHTIVCYEDMQLNLEQIVGIAEAAEKAKDGQ